MPMMMAVEGELCSGLGEGAVFTRIDWVVREFREKLGYEPYPGTLNLSLSGEAWARIREQLQQAAGIAIVPPQGFCAAKCFEVLINDCLEGAAVLPDVDDYPADKLEIVAAVAVRQELRLRDGDRVSLRVHIS
jgi:riboflavin kinase, archaea type